MVPEPHTVSDPYANTNSDADSYPRTCDGDGHNLSDNGITGPVGIDFVVVYKRDQLRGLRRMVWYKERWRILDRVSGNNGHVHAHLHRRRWHREQVHYDYCRFPNPNPNACGNRVAHGFAGKHYGRPVLNAHLVLLKCDQLHRLWRVVRHAWGKWEPDR
jgi:hypothetical protein